jgi:hypothetical protein
MEEESAAGVRIGWIRGWDGMDQAVRGRMVRWQMVRIRRYDNRGRNGDCNGSKRFVE